MRRRSAAPLALAVVLLAAPVLAEPEAKSTGGGKSKSASDLIQEGQSLHDAGRYDDAIARYRQALALQPGSATALYELALSYDAKKDYAHCVEATREGLRHPGDHGARLYSEQANCLDDSGRGAEALATYREGLAKHPHDGHLRYNYAVALWRQKKGEEAIPELVTTIGDEPTYDSPYMLLAVLQREGQRNVQSLFAFLRYLTIDRTSERSQRAATLAIALFKEGVTGKPADMGEKAQVEVVLSTDTVGSGDGLYRRLALSRSLAAASTYSGEGKTDADLVAGALGAWLAMASEAAASPEHAATTREAEWRLVAAPLLALHERDLATAFGYLVAERADISGAGDWVKANGPAMRRLEAALASAALSGH
jgi:tetratricopeptide repeat protein